MGRPNDKWLRVIFIPIIILVINLVSWREGNYTLQSFVFWTAINIVYALFMWELSIRWLLYVQGRFAGIEQTRKRVLATFAGYFLIVATMQALITWLAAFTHTARMPTNATMYVKIIAIGFAFVTLVGAIYEIIYYFQKYREAIQESEAVKKAGLQSQYENLKSQVNPHFLFNALNSLSALISEDRDKASLFLDELASVYRYLLQAGQRPLVTLAEEIKFLKAYRFLLDTRFGDGLQWGVDIEKRFLDYMLPPLALQTLIENALRHNILLPETPLTLYIATHDDGSLMVVNNLQRKRAAVLSPSGGLTLLAARYEGLGLPTPFITDNGEQFAVRLTLARKDQVLTNPTLTHATAS